MSELKRIKLDPEAAPYLKELHSTSSSKSTESDLSPYVAVVGDDDDAEDEEEELSEDEAYVDYPMWSEVETEVAAAALYAAMSMYETNIWDTCKKVCETCEAGRKFYRSFIEAIASLMYAIYDLEDLHRHDTLFPKPLLDEMILFRHQLHQHHFQYRDCSAPDTCKFLLQNIDWKKYSVLTDWGVFYLIFFCTRDMDFPPKFPARNSLFFEFEELKRKGLYDDFQKAWASVKASNTFTTYDRGIELLKEFAFRGFNLQVKLHEKAMEKIDFGALSQLDSKTFKKFDIISGGVFHRRYYLDKKILY